MKTKNMLWAALSMTAALVMTACSNDDSVAEQPAAPATPSTVTIPYTVTVSDDAASTRATVGNDYKTLRFAAGDKLYITGTNIKGVLDIQSGEGESSGATFSGELEYSGSGAPADELELTATLVSKEQQTGSHQVSGAPDATGPLFSVDDAGAVTVNYPLLSCCASVEEAVQKYSNLTGTSTYGAKNFALTQKTAFIEFLLHFEDAKTGNSEVTIFNGTDNIGNHKINIDNTDADICFVLPVASGTVLKSKARVIVALKTISFGASADKTLEGKVYKVERTVLPETATGRALANAKLGMLVGTDGLAYNVAFKDDLPSGVTAAGLVAYKNGSKGLVLALQDGAHNGDPTAAFLYAVNDYAGQHTPAVSGRTWRIPSMEEWEDMLVANGDSYKGLQKAISSAGGTKMIVDNNIDYWTSTVFNIDSSYCICFNPSMDYIFQSILTSLKQHYRTCFSF